ncbi:MAG TPA: SigE family RNA polymerase sigma factor, partial [Pilimelia sp.]|nr:SigE family RNA polymerase sigma factor [Pilimelia sp.]
PALRRLGRLLSGDEHRGDDLVQEAVTKLYVHWPRARTVEYLDAYVRAIVVRTFLDDRRRGWARVRLFSSPPEEAWAEDSGAEDRTVLRAALSRIPPRQQAVLVLRYLCDLSVAEVGEILGCSEGTVKSQSHHGLAALRARLGDRADALARTEG